MENLYEWFHDDITWCGNECFYTECERNLANRLSKTGIFSMALFKNTEICPLRLQIDKNAVGLFESESDCDNHKHKYSKKPVIIEAIRWTGTNLDEISDFINHKPEQINGMLLIPSLEGTMQASIGDYIIRGVHGEFYPCKPDIFKETYEIVSE